MRVALCAAALALALLPRHAEPRRMPATGGEVRLHAGSLPAAAIDDALTSTPLVELARGDLSPAQAAAWPTLDRDGARSRHILSARPQEQGRTWEIALRATSDDVIGALRECLETEGRWPHAALAAAGVQADVAPQGDGVTITFSAPIGAVLPLLSGCAVRSGPFAADEAAWAARPDAPGGRPLLDGVRLVTDPADADLLNDDVSAQGELLVADWPDVWLLLQDPAARAADAWGLRDEPAAMARFHRDLAPDLILAVRRGGRGSTARSLLPPGVAPAVAGPPLASGPGPAITLRDLPPDAPRVVITHRPGDPIAADLKERLALLLRGRGLIASAPSPGIPTVTIARWRPPVADIALATLLLASSFDLPVPPEALPGLLSADRATRTATSLTLERSWMDQGLAIPLLTAARTLTVSPRLRGVRMRGDGVPLLDDAWWSQP